MIKFIIIINFKEFIFPRVSAPADPLQAANRTTSIYLYWNRTNKYKKQTIPFGWNLTGVD